MPERFDLLLDIFAHIPRLIEEALKLHQSNTTGPHILATLRQQVQSVMDRMHGWIRDIPWICSLDPTYPPRNQGHLPDDSMDCVSLSICYAILLSFSQVCDSVHVNIFPEYGSPSPINSDPMYRTKYLASEICRFSGCALRGEDSANLALLLIYPLQIAWWCLQTTAQDLLHIKEIMDLAIADSYGFELGRMRQWDEPGLEQGRYGFLYK